MSIRKLEEMKRRVSEAERSRDRAQGAIDATLKTLREKFGCEDEKAAERKMRDLNRERKRLQERIAEGIEKLGEEYDWS